MNFPILRRTRSLLVVTVLAATALSASHPAGAASAAKAGGSCKRNAIGQSATVKGSVLTCTKVGSKTVWKAAATASAAAGTPAAGAASGNGPATVEGVWKVSTGSVAGYRVMELFAGKEAKNPAVGRTPGVTGGLTIAATAGALVAKDLKFDVDLTKLESDQGRRDQAIQGRGLEISKFPSATFAATEIALPADAGKNGVIKVNGKGKLTLHGVTKDVMVPIDAQILNGTLEVSGQIPITMADYGIEPPTFAGFVTVDDNGIIEFLLKLTRA